MSCYQLFLPCASGTEALLADEVHHLLGKQGADLLVARTGVLVKASWQEMMQLNLSSRLAQRVLVQLVHGHYTNEADLYTMAMKVTFEDWFTADKSIKVEITAQHSPLKSLNFAALKLKDGICDRFREVKQGVRPSVDTHHPDVKIFLHLADNEATLYIDTSGDALFKRGWRQSTGDAPLKETLASAMLAASGWWSPNNAHPLPLYDPCCGSGTIVIEAAHIAAGHAPGLDRHFAFEKYLPHRASANDWQRLKQTALAAISPAPTTPFLFGSDVSHRMVDFAEKNAARAGVSDWIEFRGGDALQRTPPCKQAGILMMNPPYGERIGVGGVAKSNRSWVKISHQPPVVDRQHQANTSLDDGASFFEQLARHWKAHYGNWQAWLLSPDMKLPAKLRLKESKRLPLWNGPIECRLFRFDLLPPKPQSKQ